MMWHVCHRAPGIRIYFLEIWTRVSQYTTQSDAYCEAQQCVWDALVKVALPGTVLGIYFFLCV